MVYLSLVFLTHLGHCDLRHFRSKPADVASARDRLLPHFQLEADAEVASLHQAADKVHEPMQEIRTVKP